MNEEQKQNNEVKPPFYKNYKYLGKSLFREGKDKNGKDYKIYKMNVRDMENNKEIVIKCFGSLSTKSKQPTELQDGDIYNFGVKYKQFQTQYGLTVGKEIFFIQSSRDNKQTDSSTDTTKEDKKYNVQPVGDAPNSTKITEFVKKYLEKVNPNDRHISHFIGSYIAISGLIPNTVKELVKQFEELVKDKVSEEEKRGD